MVTLEEAEAHAWVTKEFEREYKLKENIWSKWIPTAVIIPKTSIYNKRIWGFVHKRINQNGRNEYATRKELFKYKLSTP